MHWHLIGTHPEPYHPHRHTAAFRVDLHLNNLQHLHTYQPAQATNLLPGTILVLRLRYSELMAHLSSQHIQLSKNQYMILDILIYLLMQEHTNLVLSKTTIKKCMVLIIHIRPLDESHRLTIYQYRIMPTQLYLRPLRLRMQRLINEE